MLKVTSYLELDCEAHHLVDRINRTTIGLTFSESAILSHLLTTPDAICDKEVLLQVGWPDRVVAATSLTQCVSTLRKKLEPYPEVQLKTVARRGYQLHISVRSHVKMLAMNDAESIKTALYDMSLMVKGGGILALVLLIVLLWLRSDDYTVMRETNKWHADKQIPVNLGGTVESALLIYPKGEDKLHPSMWQKHIAPETNYIPSIKGFDILALTDGVNYSLASCATDVEGHCIADKMINLTAIELTPAGLDMQKFTALSHKMETRIRYNRVIIPAHITFEEREQKRESEPEFVEHHFHGDIYFPVADELLIRADQGISLVYESEDQGQFYASTCITDEDCLTTPIKYQIRGEFKQYRETIDNLEVDVFQVKVLQKDLIKPEVVSASAMHFYREIRKHNIRDEELFYYRIHQDKQTAVWIVPLMGNIVVWTKYEKVEL
ncbi:winged helix-turn-helix domain-containing protein [Shewanella sp. D64]|uniref:winged helix-turn-helix domain-containing protein n=1 Tax=unclassified Shewanella TaxID=196818 RepID=UPI0022BA517B|nr:MULTISPECIES: winged helix-turn-helix domain-containing protein [unclassified Shewanella]MEC4728029.1 winged helix-turn-helix domain-containing protein [Shewanella sp. D64]MEC4740126.1 winged helix-turn-helix domain-containing protein [Shewanella sp. E94]WBJ95188.1 winged helix-turn-helix domain-containing protein [Shewanella sp. MTB7]